MKIRAVADQNFASSYRVAEKRDAGDFQERMKRESDRQDRTDSDERDEHRSEAEVHEALESFEHDQRARQHGLKADVLGQGPGLRVVLKDGSGAVIRQMSGEEFVRLRDALTGSGKLLDQKV